MTAILKGEKLRHVAGAFPTGVAVASLLDDKQELLGMTINSFLSVSLDPALILFSAGRESKILPYCFEGKALSINILSERQKHISDHFAGMLLSETPFVHNKKEEFIKIPDAIAWYQTRIQKIIEAGDHYLVLCEIIDCERNNDMAPLVYYKGYRSTGVSV